MTETVTPTPEGKAAPRGAGSFTIPKAALNALLDNGATAYEVCTYLTLARFTDESGQFSTASISAVNRYTGANKTKGGPVDRALQRLKTIKAKSVKTVLKKVSNGKRGNAHAMIDQRVQEEIDLGPILFDRESWLQATGELLPDGPHERAEVQHVLPDFDEAPEDRVWFGNNLVSGVGGFQPLKALKNAGNVAARLLLALYEANDMETWGGVRPVGAGYGPWVRYEPVEGDVLWSNVDVKLHRAKRGSATASTDVFSRVCPFPEQSGGWSVAHNEAGEPVWRALEALQSAGLIYEVVMVLNRNATKVKLANGTEYSNIPEDAEPFYELDCRSRHGYKPEGEDGIGWATAKTAGDFGKSVTLEGGIFDGTYAAFYPKGYGCMIAGIYRLRFRVANPKNAGVKGAWAGIHQRNREALELVNRARVVAKFEPLTASPKEKAKRASESSAGISPETGFPTVGLPESQPQQAPIKNWSGRVFPPLDLDDDF